MKIEEATKKTEETIQEIEKSLAQCSLNFQNKLIELKKALELTLTDLHSMQEARVPLTMEQLREMDGKAVKIVIDDVEPLEMLALVEYVKEAGCVILTNNLGGRSEYYDDDEMQEDGVKAYSYPPAHIDRSEWTAEWVPMTDDDGCVWLECSTCEYDLDSLEESHPFCPSCGRAMMPEALAELERRLRLPEPPEEG